MRKLISSGYENETVYGYSRAVRVGNMIFVSGTTARDTDLHGDTYHQAISALELIRQALAEAGAELRHVVRTVAYVVTLDEEPLVARAHREAFAEIRPASTIVEINRLCPQTARVEIEVTAIVD